MSPSQVTALLWFGIAAAVAMFFTSVSGVLEHDTSIAVLVASIVVGAATTVWYRSAKRRADVREEERRARELADLKNRILLLGEDVSVRASKGILLVSLVGCAAVLCITVALSAPSASNSAVAIGTSCFFVLSLCFAIPAMGRYALVVGSNGISTPAYGFVSWGDIESISIRKRTHRGMTIGHVLAFYVSQLNRRTEQMHPLIQFARRIFPFARNNFVVVRLASTSIPAEVVQALCEEIWTEKTGKPNPAWHSVMSEKEVEELRRLEQQSAASMRAADLAARDPDAAIRYLDTAKLRLPSSATAPPRLSKRQSEMRDAFISELRGIDPLDKEARERALQRYVRSQLRTTPFTWAVTILVLLAVVLGLWTLL